MLKQESYLSSMCDSNIADKNTKNSQFQENKFNKDIKLNLQDKNVNSKSVSILFEQNSINSVSKHQISECQSQYQQNKTKNLVDRNKIINKLIKLGKLKNQEIAKTFGIHKQAVDKLEFNAKKKQKNKDRRQKRHMIEKPPKLTLTMEKIVQVVKADKNLRQIDVKNVVESKFGIKLSQPSISRYLKTINRVKAALNQVTQNSLSK